MGLGLPYYILIYAKLSDVIKGLNVEGFFKFQNPRLTGATSLTGATKWFH